MVQRALKICTSLATALLDHINDRKLDVFFELDEKIMGGITLDKSMRILVIVNDSENGSPEDKMGIFIIHFLCPSQMSDTDLDQYTAALQVNQFLAI